MILHGDCLVWLKELPNGSVDSLVTDPPAGISFMGKEWDSDKGGRDGWIEWMESVMCECMRVMKPGAHGLVWAIPRTSHWTATALENAGFEVRDVVTHLFGSGFPKSLDISKAIDKAAGVTREVTGVKRKSQASDFGVINDDGWEPKALMHTAPATDAAKQWQGWGTALKPASEHWILIRKPISEKTVAKNVLKHGTGGINIDASRIEASPTEQDELNRPNKRPVAGNTFMASHGREFTPAQGRFPANLILTEGEATEMLDGQSGQDVSRFFYCSKISTSERNAGLEDMPTRQVATSNGAKAALARGEEYLNDSSGFEKIKETKNTHPTVKPKKLMSYLIRMITPPGGTVLDPFMGSGSTGIAAKKCGFKFIGIEKEKEYFDIAEKRIGETLL